MSGYPMHTKFMLEYARDYGFKGRDPERAFVWLRQCGVDVRRSPNAALPWLLVPGGITGWEPSATNSRPTTDPTNPGR